MNHILSSCDPNNSRPWRLSWGHWLLHRHLPDLLRKQRRHSVVLVVLLLLLKGKVGIEVLLGLGGLELVVVVPEGKRVHRVHRVLLRLRRRRRRL